MPTQDGFVEYVKELLAPLEGVGVKRMFGGFGIYRGDRMFGLVANDTLYFKVDAQNKSAYLRLGLTPFEYLKRGKPCYLSYYEVPNDALDDSQMLCEWAEKAYAAAVRAAVANGKKRVARKPRRPKSR